MKHFNEILFKTAVLSMGIDGELHKEEISFFKSFGESNTYFEEFTIEEKFREVIASINEDLDSFIMDLAEEVRAARLDKQHTVIILDVVMALVHSDDKIDHNEVYLISRLLEIFDLDKDFFLNRYPDLSEILADDVEIVQNSIDQLVIH